MKNNKMLMIGVLGLMFGVVFQVEAFKFMFANTDRQRGPSFLVLIKVYEVPAKAQSLPVGARKYLVQDERVAVNSDAFSKELGSDARWIGVDIFDERYPTFITVKSYNIDRENCKDIYLTFNGQAGLTRFIPMVGNEAIEPITSITKIK